MYIDYTPQQKALKKELRAYFQELFTPALREELATAEGGGPEYHKALRRMGADGWLGVGWPKEYGGQARDSMDQFIFFDEVQRAGFPIPFLTLNTVGPTLMKFGSEELRRAFLPRILRGELHFAIGYTEPEAGTDLASLKTRAVRDGDHYVVNGQKIFTSLAAYADYIWLAARTNPDAPKHKGISILIVDTKSPGYSHTPIQTLGDNITSATYYDNVRVPAGMLVGEENMGWKLITTQLNHERVALMPVGPLERFTEEVREWARETRYADGRRVIDVPWVQTHLARVHAKVEVLKLLNWRQTQSIESGFLNPAESSAVKVFGSELNVEAYKLLMEVVGEPSTLKAGSPGAVLRGRLERYGRSLLVLTFGGGTNEVQRDIIAMAGMLFPRSR
ncbi:MAG: acyl-CoA dehydrogenase family protein [Candidatus Methylomirabilis sp.]|nr:acyl-CoA dehydrogenase family protein [Deltaproteobacteria bacterium]